LKLHLHLLLGFFTPKQFNIIGIKPIWPPCFCLDLNYIPERPGLVA
jgi:hypothetical protein